MKFVTASYIGHTEEKGSKFLAFLCPFELFESTMQDLKLKHPKAVHFVYAYRYFNEFQQIVENSSDDGEPRGTSGKPVLKVLQGNELVNSAVIVVRYFGGTKLGTGGLVRAYSDSANEAIKEATLEEFEFLEVENFEVAYNELSKIEYKIAQLHLQIISKDFGEKVNIKIQGTKEKLIKLFEMI